eukprot:CAMPEP_0173459894 /NCGR_PEP_ID=MMETSP1357-20121228/62200_1 /TAXON_ID=77926 /ORGANISM="Hemiselmis rufescens, Strain PCC563" /LENGTH=295 /DNA_ID=CAMNT_0014427401 /DNA_START=59 /DNA_END=942 /DNA_ORIENTATION=+
MASDDSAKGPVRPHKRGAAEKSWYLKPEIITFGILFLALPVFGILAYRTIAFQIAEVMNSFNSHPCIFSHTDRISGDVKNWDLTGLSRSRENCGAGAKSCKDYSVVREDETFYMNICRFVMNKPNQCTQLYGGAANVPRSIGYQTADGVCYYMGQLATGKWSLLDKRNPSAGVKLTYRGGSQCDGSTDRSTHYHFECDPTAGVGRPVAVFGDCEFVVRWRTAHACPIQTSSFLSSLFWVAALVVLFLTLGFAYNVKVNHMLPDWEAVPQIHTIRHVGALVTIAAVHAWDLAVRAL